MTNGKPAIVYETILWKYSYQCNDIDDDFLVGIYWILCTPSSRYFLLGTKKCFLLIYGLIVCCFAAARDGLDKTIQYTIDGSCAPGLFSLISVPTVIGCVGALLIVIGAMATPLSKSQYARQMWFYVMSSGVILKIATIEISRIFLAIK